MYLSDKIYMLMELSAIESEHNIYAHSEEYNRLRDEIESKAYTIDLIEKEFGCPIELVFELLKLSGWNRGVYFDTVDTDGIERKGLYKFTLDYDGINKKLFLNTGWNGETYLSDHKKTWWIKNDRSNI